MGHLWCVCAHAACRYTIRATVDVTFHTDMHAAKMAFDVRKDAAVMHLLSGKQGDILQLPGISILINAHILSLTLINFHVLNTVYNYSCIALYPECHCDRMLHNKLLYPVFCSLCRPNDRVAPLLLASALPLIWIWPLRSWSSSPETTWSASQPVSLA